jgi:hypothetical protein
VEKAVGGNHQGKTEQLLNSLNVKKHSLNVLNLKMKGGFCPRVVVLVW